MAATDTRRFDPQRQITLTETGEPLANSLTAYSQTPSGGNGGGRNEYDMEDFTGIGAIGSMGVASPMPDPARTPLALALHTTQFEAAA